ncbi:hypothetical protein AB6A40_001057 [Gnathostoma spinigerum]|uniref:MIF4G domain-containing protein n=1 Tax=Gnathostoma spinigerum TaxID=75299 RepID=A0ABD6E3B5_9BILA
MSSNPRGKQRKAGSIPEFNGQHISGPALSGVPPPGNQQSQILPNGRGTDQSRQTSSIAFAMPSVDRVMPPNHIPQNDPYRPPRTPVLNNPTIQFGPGQVEIETASPGQVTVHPVPRFTAPAQGYAQPSQVGSFQPQYQTQSMYPYPFSTGRSVQAYYQTVQVPMPSSVSYFQYPSDFNQIQYQGPMLAPSYTSVTRKPEKKIMKIVDPKTMRVTNEDEINVSLHSSDDYNIVSANQSTSFKDGRKGSSEETMRETAAQSMPSNASQKFSRQVAQSVLADASASTSVSAPATTSTSVSLSQSTSLAADPPTQCQQTTPANAEISTVSSTSMPLLHDLSSQETQQTQSVVSASVPIPPSPDLPWPSTSNDVSYPPAVSTSPQLASTPVQNVILTEHAENSDSKVASDMKPQPDPEIPNEPEVFQPQLKPKEHTEEFDEYPRIKETEPEEIEPVTQDVSTEPIENGVEDKDSAETGSVEATPETDLVAEKSKVEELPTIRETSSSIEPANSKEEEEAVEPSENMEPEESNEVKMERRRKELEEKQLKMFVDKEAVRVEERFYDRAYLLLMRDIVKELKENTCPVPESQLVTLGIDIASAPPAGNTDKQSRRYDSTGGPGSRAFAPGWMEKNINRKAYPGRLSDRTHVNRDRRKASINRPSIDRPVREQVKLHKAEHAWKPDKDDTADKKLFKEVRALLNKITPSTFKTLSQDFLNYKIYTNKKNMSEVIDIIFDKAVEEPKFCPLYSDLCKAQDMYESNDTGTCEFRNGILTRCQQTFETKRQDEINKKNEEAAAETDEAKQKELKIEAMEMEAKERRRMFGNIGFIGQLYRHELIVPKILNWCIIHLLRSHGQSKGGDEESVECAVKMIETVGRIAERQAHPDFNVDKYCSHLKEIAPNVSNRVRFLILNLLELKENHWNPRKSTEQGPKTIKQVHEEAAQEEMMNKLHRDQYEQRRMPYEGRGSSDRRNTRVLSGRPSQDGRFGPKRHESNKELKNARAAVAANSVTSTASKKNLSLNSMDQAGSLGARRPQFILGSGGGGQQVERKVSKVGGNRASGPRGSLRPREDSQPSSREPSESRKVSLSDERTSALSTYTNSGTMRMSSSTLSGGGSSSNALDESSAAQDQLIAKSIPSAVPPINDRKLATKLSSDISEYATDAIGIEEVHSLIMESCSVAPVRVVFRLLLQAGADKSGIDGNIFRRYVGQVLCKCLQNDEIKEEALQGCADFCSSVVEQELWEDNMRIWEVTAEVIIWSIMCNTDHFPGPRPSLLDFKASFKNSEADTRKKHALLVHVLKRLVEIGDEVNGGSPGMAFDEISELHTDSLLQALKACQLPQGNLLDLLK